MSTQTIDSAELPFFDISDPLFSVSSREIAAARDRGWCARTPFGLAVLRYDQVSALLKDRRLRQGSFAWPAQERDRGGAAGGVVVGDHAQQGGRRSPAAAQAGQPGLLAHPDRADGAGVPGAGRGADRRLCTGWPLRVRLAVRRALRGTGAVQAGGHGRGTLARPVRLVDRSRVVVRSHHPPGTWSRSSRRSRTCTPCPTS